MRARPSLFGRALELAFDELPVEVQEGEPIGPHALFENVRHQGAQRGPRDRSSAEPGDDQTADAWEEDGHGSSEHAPGPLDLDLVFGRRGLLAPPIQSLGIDIAFTTVAVVLAQTFVSAPFFVRAARSGIAAVDRDLEDAARVDGANERQVFRAVTVPLAGATLAAGLVMSWARSLGEFGATIMFAGNVEGRTQTLPLVVYAEFQAGELDASIAAAAISTRPGSARASSPAANASSGRTRFPPSSTA